MREVISLEIDGVDVDRVSIHYKCPRCKRQHARMLKWENEQIECSSTTAKVATVNARRFPPHD